MANLRRLLVLSDRGIGEVERLGLPELVSSDGSDPMHQHVPRDPEADVAGSLARILRNCIFACQWMALAKKFSAGPSQHWLGGGPISSLSKSIFLTSACQQARFGNLDRRLHLQKRFAITLSSPNFFQSLTPSA